jgi:tetratricopeptide (TPR) repeat protein
MSSRHDLPRRHRSHDTEQAAVFAFEGATAALPLFIVQSRDRNDYGTDVQIEARDGDRMTNLRVHAQLKGTEGPANADGSVSVPVDIENLNYLLAQPDAIYAFYHLPSQRLLARYAISVYRELEHRGPSWREQKTVTIRCAEAFDEAFQRRLHDRVMASGTSGRQKRAEWSVTPPEQSPALVQRAVPIVEVPPEPTRAKAMVMELYGAGHDAVISAHFPHFAAVLQSEPGAMDVAYMAEINLGLQGAAFNQERVRRGIDVLEEAIARHKIHPGSILYCQANGWMALREYEKAKDLFQKALQLLDDPRVVGVAAQCHKNLGTVFEELHDEDEAVAHFERALQLDPDLGEAHYALALHWLHRKKDPRAALAHLDAVTLRRGSAMATPGLQGWRIEALFQTGDAIGAFREMQSLLAVADRFPWVWPSCARQVARYGRATTDSTRKALSFWRAYIAVHPDNVLAERYRLLCIWSLHGDGVSTGMNFQGFKDAAVCLMERGDPDSAFLWDRVGHWAQRDGDWGQAEEAFRKAYELESGEYGYCLGTALNFLDRHAEALPILLSQAETHQPDARSWFQVAVAREGVGDVDGSIAAYERALKLDPEYDHALFNLGGLYWNRRDIRRALKIWKDAVKRFPDHSKVPLLRDMLPSVFGSSETEDSMGSS